MTRLTTYRYRVFAYNGVGNSGYSIQSAQQPAEPIEPLPKWCTPVAAEGDRPMLTLETNRAWLQVVGFAAFFGWDCCR